MRKCAFGLAVLLVAACGSGTESSDSNIGGASTGASTSLAGQGNAVAGNATMSAAGVSSGASSGNAGSFPNGGGASVSAGAAGVNGLAGASGVGGTSGAPFKGVANSPCAARALLNVSWYYNWEQKETDPCGDGKGGEFVPMIWGHAGTEQTASGIQSAIAGFVTQGYKQVLGFNEPDNGTQSNISVTTAIQLLPAFDNPRIAVGTPATQANSTGQAWLKSYMGDVAADATLRADFIAIHWYGWNAGSCDAQAAQLESYLKYAEGFPGNRPIWLTEWGCLNQSAPTSAGVVNFYQGALAVFAKHPRLVRYAWYPWSDNCHLNNDDGSLTDLGKAYAAAAATR